MRLQVDRALVDMQRLTANNAQRGNVDPWHLDL
jgi:hypothetical protein